MLLVNLARVVFAPLLEPLRAAFQLDPAAAGLLASLAWVGSALPRLPVGYLLTRVPRHSVVATAGAVLAGSAALASVAGSFRALAVAALLMGLSSGAYFIAANPLISELFPRRVGRAVGVHGTASQLAAVGAAPFVTGVLLVSDWRLAFRLVSVAAVLATVAFVALARRTDLPDAGAADRRFLAAARGQWRLVVTGVAVIGATGFAWNGVFNFYVTYLGASRQIAEPAARQLLTVVFAAGVPAFWVTGRLADRVPYVPLLLAVLGGFVASLLALTAAASTLTLVAASAAIGYVAHSTFPAIDTYLLDSLPDAHRASAYSVYSAGMMLSMAPGGWAVGTLRERGMAFGDIFHLFAAVLTGILVVLVVLYLGGMLPEEGRKINNEEME